MQALFTEKPVTVLQMVVDTDAVMNEVSVYLSNHTIDGYRCTCDRVEHDPVMMTLTVHLRLEDGTSPDEEFEHDASWQKFCGSLAKRLNGITPRLPSHYYHK
jgi:hypothetical protein